MNDEYVYDRAYEKAMDRINDQADEQRHLAKQALSWITCAKRPLTSTELQHALALEEGQSTFDMNNVSDMEDIISVCAGLVAVDKESHVVRLVHYSTHQRRPSVQYRKKRGDWTYTAKRSDYPANQGKNSASRFPPFPS